MKWFIAKRSDRGSKRHKPTKPYPDCPLYPHSGQWAKTINYRTVYFGSCDDPTGAIEKYLREQDDPRTIKISATGRWRPLDERVNRCLASKQAAAGANPGKPVQFHSPAITADG
jgi:hypothetical protein